MHLGAIIAAVYWCDMRKAGITVLIIAVLVFIWHLILWSMWGGPYVNINPITDVAIVKMPGPSAFGITDPQTAAAFEGGRDLTGVPIGEHKLNNYARQYLDVYAMVLPYRVSIVNQVVAPPKESAPPGNLSQGQTQTQFLKESSPVENISPGDLNQYQVYTTKISDAIYLKSLFNDYLAGGSGWVNESNHAAEENDRAYEFNLLDKWDKSYFKSKFIVVHVNKAPVGGNVISILFLDKPDRVFNAWVYTLYGGEQVLRGFDLAGLNEEEMVKIRALATNLIP